MNDLVFLKRDEVLTDTLTVAEMFGKRHAKLVTELERMYPEMIEGYTPNGEHPYFYKTWYKNPQNNQRYRKYLMNRDGFMFLVMGFTGEKAKEWKKTFIKAFNQMEKVIQQKSTDVWLENRKRGMLTRKEECDTLKKLVEYAKEQGSTHADMLYMTYSKLANAMSGVKNRDQATSHQLDTLNFMENIILHMVEEGIEAGTHYKQIYRNCKERMETVKTLGYLEVAS